VEACLSCPEAFMLKAGPDKRVMLSLTNRRDGRCARWCALVVMLAVCSLAISVATRYNSSEGSSRSTSKSLHKQSIEEPSRQRLTKNAAQWIPPVVVAAILYVPTSDSRVAVARPEIPNCSFCSNLYYRPPPSSASL
jgi:hypothetical protein